MTTTAIKNKQREIYAIEREIQKIKRNAMKKVESAKLEWEVSVKYKSHHKIITYKVSNSALYIDIKAQTTDAEIIKICEEFDIKKPHYYYSLILVNNVLFTVDYHIHGFTAIELTQKQVEQLKNKELPHELKNLLIMAAKK